MPLTTEDTAVPTPPPLSAQSADRMTSVVEAADRLVDGGCHPDEALAKAASQHGLPHGHVSLVVRAFNTARAVRQLEEKDVWAKAAAYPVASEDGVRAVLASPPALATKQARDDYAVPPDLTLPTEPPPIWTRVPCEGERTKAASVAAPPAPKPPTVLASQFEAARAFDEAAAAVRGLPDREYAGVRKVAAYLYPTAAEFFFGEVEEALPACRRKAASAAAPSVGVDHPAVVLVGRLGEVKAAYVPEKPGVPPEGYQKVASEPGIDLYRKRPPLVLQTPASRGLSAALIPEAQKDAKDANDSMIQMPGRAMPAIPAMPPVPASPPISPSVPMAPVSPAIPTAPPAMSTAAATPPMPVPPMPVKSGPSGGIPDPKPEPPKTAADNRFLSAFSGATSPLQLLSKSVYSGPMMDSLKATTGGDGGLQSATGRLESGLKRLDNQASIQELMADPRFAKADPRVVVESYRQLSGIAPMAMANPAIAADFLNRRLQTGPPSYYDLKVLTDLERNLGQIRQSGMRQPEEED